MNSQANFLDILILLGALQGFITAVLLFLSSPKHLAKNLLGWLLLLISMACLNMYLLNINFTNQSTVLQIAGAIVPLIIIMPIGPLSFFYVKTLTDNEFNLTKQLRRQFLPAIFDLVPYVAALVYFLGVSMHFINPAQSQSWGNFIDGYNMYFDIPRWISISIYLWLSMLVIKSTPITNKNRKSMVWVKQFVIGMAIFQFMWLLYLIPYVIPNTSNILLGWVGWYPVYIPLMILVYWLGVNGFFLSPLNNRSKLLLPTSDPKIAEKTIAALTRAMAEEKLYLNPTLGLQDIVTYTGINQKTISYALNQHLGKSFKEFVNEYRVNEVINRLGKAKFDHLTIMGIAYECGFNSQATFQRVFKSITKKSPKSYRQFLTSKNN